MKREYEVLMSVARENINQPKHLSEWRQELNKHLPKRDSMSERDVAFAIRVIRQKNLLYVDKDSSCYCFSTL